MSWPAALLLLLGAAQSPAAEPFTVAETGESFDTLQDAVKAIGAGAGTIRIQPGRYRECAVQEAGQIAFVAAVPGTSLFEGGICEGKATLVLRGRSARVEGLSFTGTRVPDGNGAGIRIERGDLDVVSSRFFDAQTGILSADDPRSAIRIDRSTFSGLGKHPDEHGVHSIYIGRYGSLSVRNSRFERGRSGHYLKSRSPRIEVISSSFDDSRGRDTSYMIDLPYGAVGRIAGNLFVNGPAKDNHGTMIAVAAEERRHSSEGLVVEGNRAWLASGSPGPTSFVGNWSSDGLVVRNNRLGPGMSVLDRRWPALGWLREKLRLYSGKQR